MKYLILVLVLSLVVCGAVVAQQLPTSSSPQQNTSDSAQSSPAAQDHGSAEAPPSSTVGATSASGFPGQRSSSLNNDPVHLMREISDGLNKNDVHRLEKLAASGDATAAARVGCAYWVGVGVKRNTTTSVNWLSKAAEGGSGAAALLLGTIDAGQSGVPADYERAEMWLIIAKSAGITVPAEALKTLQQLAGAEKIASGDTLAKRWLASHKVADDRPRELWAASRSPLPAYKVGPGTKTPEPVYTPDPAYPELERRAGKEASVLLWLIVDERGKPRDIKVSRSAGREFDENAIEAVRRWQFKPAERHGRPVAVQINVEVNFRLWRRP